MNRLTQLAAVALALALGGAALADPPEGRTYRAALKTSDGVRATLYRYVPDTPEPPKRAVLLLPDVGMTYHSFDYGGRGLARFLVRRGIEVFVLEYRGAGHSEVPFGGYVMEDLLDKDVEAAFSRALQGRDRIWLGGCGLGGTMALVLAGRHPEQVAGVIGLQAAVTLDVPNEPVARLLEKLEAAPAWINLPLAAKEKLFGERSWFEVLAAGDRGVPADELEGLRLHTLAPVPKPLVEQVAGFMRQRRIVLGGKDVAEQIRLWKGRTFLVFASRDNWIHPEFATPARDLLDPAQTHVAVLNRLEGAEHDYSHLGMLLGARVEADLFARIAQLITWGKLP